mgnify:CR=1 FL=1
MNQTTTKLLQDLVTYGHVPVSLFKANERNAVAVLEAAGLVRVFHISDDLARVELRLSAAALNHFTITA